MSYLNKVDKATIDALRRKGYRATPQRIAVCRYALTSEEHPTAQKTYLEVKKNHPTVSLATVYKTLQILRELNLIQELDLPHSQARFDPNMEPHVNLVCQKCGAIQDLDYETAGDFLKKVTKTAEFVPSGQRLDIYGVCQKCAAKTKKQI